MAGSSARAAAYGTAATAPMLRRLAGATRRRGDGSQPERDPILVERRPLYVFGLILVVASIPLQQPLLAIAGLLVCALGAVPEVWYRWGLRALDVSRSAPRRAEFGDVVEVTMTVENRKPLPLPWFELADEFTDSLPARGVGTARTSAVGRLLHRQSTALWAYQRVRRRYLIRAAARGAFPFGPLTFATTDPFGILRRQETVNLPASLLVHPLVVPLERFGLPSSAPFGDRKAPRRLLEDPLRTVGTRDYVPGDEPRRIHWKATARAGALQSKVYEPATRHTVVILLDMRTLGHNVMGYDPPLAELAVTIAASVATWAIEQRFAVGIYSNGTLATVELDDAAAPAPSATPQGAAQGDRTPLRDAAHRTGAMRLAFSPSSDGRQLTRILDGLARVLPYYSLPLQDVVAAEARQFPFGATVVYVGCQSVVDVPLILALRQLQQRGHATTLLLTRPSRSETAEEDVELYLAGMSSHVVGGRALWQELRDEALGEGEWGAPQNGATGATPGNRAGQQAGETSTADARVRERRSRALALE